MRPKATGFYVIASHINQTRQNVACALAKSAWRFATEGNFDSAYLAYSLADDLLPAGKFNAELSVLRHTLGTASPGMVEPIPATEDVVYAFYVCGPQIMSKTGDGMKSPEVNGTSLEQNIRAFLDTFDPGFHRENITQDLPHVLVMSTGRCGTMSLYKLFERSQLVPYHVYWWQNIIQARLEAMCRMIDGNMDNTYVFRDWLATRAAEWLGAISQDRAMVGLNHLDTIFAPVFATVHPKSRFVYLRRDPMAIFESFYGKHQWLTNQLSKVDYTFNPEFRLHMPKRALPEEIAWYIHFTETFSRAVGRIMGKRFIEIQAEDLFSQNRGEIARLLEFTGADIPLDDAVAHFGTRINEKAHKATEVDDFAREIFRSCRFS